ncbi:hypothetical protein C8R41DRAFT_978909 [Lentinula lateritia]|uniref:DUF6532 domain-containing protein n=1 Tax=Lentinula lateritia TaxID=40482 RepID=A0ABQ8VQ57_9AGAR|nr:hypothetical protein C8R41DRAFT_978909 [Lentinula lateritia]
MEDDDDNNGGDESEEFSDILPPPTQALRKRKQLAESNTTQRSTHDADVLRRKLEAMEAREAKLKKKMQSYQDKAASLQRDRDEDPESEDETGERQDIQFSSTAVPLPTLSTPTPQIQRVYANHRRTKSRSLLLTPSHASPTSRPTTNTAVAGQGSISNPTDLGTTSTNDSSQTLKLPTLHMALNFQAGSRAKLDDYDGEGKAVILRAIRDFEARVMGKNFFPSDTTRARWAEDSFQAACAHLQVDYLSDKRVLTLIQGRGSCVRGDLIDKAEVPAHNYSAFLYKDSDKLIGYAENPMLLTFFTYVFVKKMALSFEAYFTPFTLEALAGWFMTIRFAIDEWSSGQQRITLNFSEQDNKLICDQYLAKAVPAKKAAGVSHIEGEVEKAMRIEMMARTGDTDSEQEESDEEDDIGSADIRAAATKKPGSGSANGGESDAASSTAGIEP